MQRNAENFVTKLEELRKKLLVRFPSLNVRDLTEKMSKLAHYHYKEYRALLSHMYGSLGAFSHKAYLSFETIRSLAKQTGKLSVHKAIDLDLKLVLQLPFILEWMEYENPTLKNLLVQLLNLEEYEKTIGKLELQHLPVLQEQRKQDEWSRTGDKIAYLLPKLQKQGIGLVGLHKGGHK